MKSSDVPVLDTETAELWLADTYVSGAERYENNDPEFGIVCLCRFSRKDGYIYYITLEKEKDNEVNRLRRCNIDGSGKEILYTITLDKKRPFDMIEASTMFEDADGNLLIVGVNKLWYGEENGTQISIARFTPYKNYWLFEVVPLGIPYPALMPYKTVYSLTTGNALLCMRFRTSGFLRGEGISSDVKILSLRRSLYVNLARILPEKEIYVDLWYAYTASDKYTDAELIPSDEYLNCLKSMIYEGDYSLPEGYDPDKPSDCFQIDGACISPDGRYALLNAIVGKDEYCLYLANLDSMELLPIEYPEDIVGSRLSSFEGFLFESDYIPKMTWSENGTIILINSEGIAETFSFDVN